MTLPKKRMILDELEKEEYEICIPTSLKNANY